MRLINIGRASLVAVAAALALTAAAPAFAQDNPADRPTAGAVTNWAVLETGDWQNLETGVVYRPNDGRFHKSNEGVKAWGTPTCQDFKDELDKLWRLFLEADEEGDEIARHVYQTAHLLLFEDYRKAGCLA